MTAPGDVPPARQCTMCDREAVDPERSGGLCPDHAPDADGGALEDDAPTADTTEDADNRPPEGGSTPSNPTPHGDASGPSPADATDTGPGWGDADFSTVDPDTYPPALLAREQWMARRGKLPFAPWGDRDAPLACGHTYCPDHAPDAPEDVVADCPDCRAHQEGTTTAECSHDARYKWGHSGHYVDGDTVDMVEPDRRLDGRVFLQQEADPFAFVDGDDVRDPDTDEVHPAFVRLLERLGVTYADVSDSGTGVHAYYRGDLPGEQGQAVFQIDTDPWGANDDPPTVEIYANTHVNVTTGDHVAGTPTDVVEWDTDALGEILDERDARKEADPVAHDTDRDRPDLADHTPTATAPDETTTDVRDVLKAVDQLGVRDLPLRARKVGTDATGWEQWNPSSYRTSSGNDSLHRPPGEPVFHDFKHGESFGVLSLFAAERGIISKPWDRLDGSDWWDTVDAARDHGAPIPEYVGSKGDPDAEPVAPLALAKLDALAAPDRERYARKRGFDIPATDDVRADLRDALFREIRAGNRTVLDAPTALGKSHTVATTRWRDHADVTGEAPVVHFHPTTDARDDAAAETRASPATGAVLKGRKERCPVAAGDHDPAPDGEADPDEIVTVDGEPAREWFDRLCDGKGLPFSTAHAIARERNDQDRDALPCCEDGDCPAVTQWDGLPRDDDGHPTVDVIHATHQFAYVPSLRQGTNVVLDEQPDFTTDLGQERIRGMITAYLRAIDAPVRTWEKFVSLARADLAGGRSDAARERDVVDDALGDDPGRDWYVTDPDAHALAPDLARALWNALRWGDDDANGRRSGGVLHEPPRLDADDGDGYAGVWLSVVVDDTNTVQTVRATPDLSQARAVVGLDAHPSMPMWELNTGGNLDMTRDAILDPTERALWRRYERGLTVVQVGDATRPRSGDTAREWMNDERVRTVVDRLRDHYGEDFATAISPVQVERAVREILDDVAEGGTVDEDSTMHYGEEKSRNDFADERVGYLYGCMDPGDGMVLDALAELNLDAEPGTATTEAGDTVREKGRTFDGPDADTARALLASVRENHVAQAAGRYARNPDDDESRATVYVHTDAMPAGFADLQVPGVEWLATDTQRAIVDALAERPTATTRELADAVDCSKEHVRQTLARLRERDLVARRDAAGDHGADVYRDAGADHALADLGTNATSNEPLRVPSRWSLVVRHADAGEDGPPGGTDAGEAGTAPVDGGDPPPDPAD